MKNHGTHAFVNQLLACTLVLAGATGSVGLGAVWMRHQVSVTAKANKDLEKKIESFTRKLADVNSEVAVEESREALLHRNEEWKLGLILPLEHVQVKRVGENVAARLAGKRNGAVFSDVSMSEARLVLGGNR